MIRSPSQLEVNEGGGDELRSLGEGWERRKSGLPYREPVGPWRPRAHLVEATGIWLCAGLSADFGGFSRLQGSKGRKGTGAQRERRLQEKGHGQDKKLCKTFAHINRRAWELSGSSQGKIS